MKRGGDGNASSVWVVDGNALTGRLLVERLLAGGIRAQAMTSFERVLRLRSTQSSTAVWNCPWPHAMTQLEHLAVYTRSLRILVLGAGCPAEVQTGLLFSGARGYLDHSAAWDEMVAAVMCVARGGRNFTPQVMSATIDMMREGTGRTAMPATNLTRREAEILDHLVRGACNKEIAQSLGVMESTIKSHLQTIYSKRGVSGRLALVLQVLSRKPIGADASFDPASLNPLAS